MYSLRGYGGNHLGMFAGALLWIIVVFPPPVRWGFLDFYVSCPAAGPEQRAQDQDAPRQTSQRISEDIPDRTDRMPDIAR